MRVLQYSKQQWYRTWRDGKPLCGHFGHLLCGSHERLTPGAGAILVQVAHVVQQVRVGDRAAHLLPLLVLLHGNVRARHVHAAHLETRRPIRHLSLPLHLTLLHIVQ